MHTRLQRLIKICRCVSKNKKKKDFCWTKKNVWNAIVEHKMSTFGNNYVTYKEWGHVIGEHPRIHTNYQINDQCVNMYIAIIWRMYFYLKLLLIKHWLKVTNNANRTWFYTCINLSLHNSYAFTWSYSLLLFQLLFGLLSTFYLYIFCQLVM